MSQLLVVEVNAARGRADGQAKRTRQAHRGGGEGRVGAAWHPPLHAWRRHWPGRAPRHAVMGREGWWRLFLCMSERVRVRPHPSTTLSAPWVPPAAASPTAAPRCRDTASRVAASPHPIARARCSVLRPRRVRRAARRTRRTRSPWSTARARCERRGGRTGRGARRGPRRPPRPSPVSSKDLAKTNLAFVSPRDPVVAHTHLEINGW